RILSEGINQIDPKAGREFAEQVKQTEGFLGFRLDQDLLQTLGDSWCVYNSPGEGGLFITGLTVIVPVKDHDRLVKTNGRLILRIGAQAIKEKILQPGGESSGVFVKETAF